MDEYEVVIVGGDEAQLGSQLAALSRLLEIDLGATLDLLMSLPTVVRTRMSHDHAVLYRNALETMGARSEVRRMERRSSRAPGMSGDPRATLQQSVRPARLDPYDVSGVGSAPPSHASYRPPAHGTMIAGSTPASQPPAAALRQRVASEPPAAPPPSAAASHPSTAPAGSARPSNAPPASVRPVTSVVCGAHGLSYDPRLTGGCALCRREIGELVGATASDHVSFWMRYRNVASVLLVAATLGSLFWSWLR